MIFVYVSAPLLILLSRCITLEIDCNSLQLFLYDIMVQVSVATAVNAVCVCIHARMQCVYSVVYPQTLPDSNPINLSIVKICATEK